MNRPAQGKAVTPEQINANELGGSYVDNVFSLSKEAFEDESVNPYQSVLTQIEVEMLRQRFINMFDQIQNQNKEGEVNESNKQDATKGPRGLDISQVDGRTGGVGESDNTELDGARTGVSEKELQDPSLPTMDIQSDKDSDKRGESAMVISHKDPSGEELRAEYDEAYDNRGREETGSREDTEGAVPRPEHVKLSKLCH